MAETTLWPRFLVVVRRGEAARGMCVDTYALSTVDTNPSAPVTFSARTRRARPADGSVDEGGSAAT
jgi:hypothetical protein